MEITHEIPVEPIRQMLSRDAARLRAVKRPGGYSIEADIHLVESKVTDILHQGLYHSHRPLLECDQRVDIYWPSIQDCISISAYESINSDYSVLQETKYPTSTENSLVSISEADHHTGQAMQYSDDIEMWEFDQILDKSPLSALTADFAKFKERFVRMFEAGSNGPLYDSDNECNQSNYAKPQDRARVDTQQTQRHSAQVRQNGMDRRAMSNGSSSHYYPESNNLPRQKPQPRNSDGNPIQSATILSDIERIKYYTNLQHGGSLESLKGNVVRQPGHEDKYTKSLNSVLDSNRLSQREDKSRNRPAEKEKLCKMKSYPGERSQHREGRKERLCKVKSNPSMSVPAKRPTDLPVIPHIITQEYVLGMKTKGFSSADATARPKDRLNPRLTQSYLAEHHNYNNDHNTTSTIHDWQFNKSQQNSQQSQQTASNYAKQPRNKQHHCQHNGNSNNNQSQSNKEYQSASHSARSHLDGHPDNSQHLQNDIQNRWYDRHTEETFTQRQQVPSRPHTYLTHDNRLLEEDAWRGAASMTKQSQDGKPLFNQKTSLGATHRGTHRFVPRHSDEMQIEIGDSIHVLSEADDGWCMGINLTTQSQGIFPSVYATDLEFYEVNEDTAVKQPTHKLFKLHFLGSMEVSHHKGSDILVDAIEKIILNRRISKDTTTPPLCQLEVSEAGIKMIDLTHKKRSRKLVSDLNIDSACERLSQLLAFSKETKAVSNHFFSLKNVSFCGYHPDNPRYFGFITKHPTQQRFACHCYSSMDESTQPIVDTIGEAFNHYYNDFIPFSDSSEDVYLE